MLRYWRQLWLLLCL